MQMFLMIVHVFVSIVLISVILLQAGRGGGVSEMFGGSSTNTIFGTSATKFLMRATTVCAVLFILTSLSLAMLSSGRSKSLMSSKSAMTKDMENAMDVPLEESVNEVDADTAAVAIPVVKTADFPEEAAGGAEEEVPVEEAAKEEVPVEP
ncbi:MAG: preprotein translocase subunit SecG [Candidatus Omnitrophica bacterium]|nr:preprotein translocase subunit SecG [Candidatus Omnitrophota bacterium]